MVDLLRSPASALVLVALASAQTPVLVYDNGPIETAPGISRVQNVTLGLTAPGFGGFRAPGAAVGYACADDFGVTNPMRIDEVELFCYQNNSGTTSTITGVYLQFFAADPSAGAAPLGTGPKFSTNLLTSSSINAWSGIYRDLESLPGATNRPLMQVRVALPQPLQLTAGVYWLEVQLTGSLSSGPWLPPVTVAGQAVTGDAMQQDTVTGTWIAVPMQSGTAAQGLPFRFYGAGQSPGTITQVASGCGPATIRVAGALQVGGFLRIELGNTHAISVIGFDLAATPTSYCGCTFVHNFPVTVWFATQHTLALPMVPALGGLILGVQGADLSLSGGGTCLGAVDVTDGFAAAIGM